MTPFVSVPLTISSMPILLSVVAPSIFGESCASEEGGASAKDEEVLNLKGDTAVIELWIIISIQAAIYTQFFLCLFLFLALPWLFRLSSVH